MRIFLSFLGDILRTSLTGVLLRRLPSHAYILSAVALSVVLLSLLSSSSIFIQGNPYIG
ncbi:MAG: hypothetical protein ACRD8Z_23620 [Nitrososphaeraceae archaeon]